MVNIATEKAEVGPTLNTVYDRTSSGDSVQSTGSQLLRSSYSYARKLGYAIHPSIVFRKENLPEDAIRHLMDNFGKKRRSLWTVRTQGFRSIYTKKPTGHLVERSTPSFRGKKTKYLLSPLPKS